MHGGGAPGAGSPAKLGKDSGTGTSPSGGAAQTGSGMGTPPPGGGGNGDGDIPSTSGNGSAVPNNKRGAAGPGADAQGDDDSGGGGNGHLALGDDQVQPNDLTPAAATTGTAHPPLGPGGSLQLGPPATDPGVENSKPAGKVVTALDYRYDKSGLPHYPNALKVSSGTDAAAAAAAAGPNTKNFSVTEIVTDDAPEVAAAWYHAHLPAGWNELQMPSAPAMDQAIAQSKAPAANSDPVNAMLNAMITGPQIEQSKPGIDAARAAGLTIFQPPNQQTDHRMIIVIKDNKTGKTGVLLMKKAD